MSLRLFAALPIPDEIADRLETLQDGLGWASWRPRENFHITLRFFDEMDEAVARDLDFELGRIVEAPFELRLKGVGSFGGKEPSGAWAGVEAPAVLQRLNKACERAAKTVGLALDVRNFRPHVTLAYLGRTTSDVEVARWQERFGAFETKPFWADHFALYSSRPTKSKNVYVEEAVYPLTGASGLS